MNQALTTVAASALIAGAILSMPTFSSKSSVSHAAIISADEITGAKRTDRRQVRYGRVASSYRGNADPSFGPDGRPYAVPENLRNQCYIDMGYGRFQACTSR